LRPPSLRVCCCVNMLPAQSRGACAFCAIMPLCVVYGPGTEPCTGERACRASAMARATLPPAVDFCKLRSFAGSLTLRLQSEGVAHARTRMHAREHTPSVTSWHTRPGKVRSCLRAPAEAHLRVHAHANVRAARARVRTICATPCCAGLPLRACARPSLAAPPGSYLCSKQSCLFLTGRR
jgi:hypothetical protein